MSSFIRELRQYRHILPKQTISTLRGQALSGDLEGAIKGLQTALNKKQSNKDKMTNAHRGTRYIIKNYGDVDYKTQLSINLRVNGIKERGGDMKWVKRGTSRYITDLVYSYDGNETIKGLKGLIDKIRHFLKRRCISWVN